MLFLLTLLFFSLSTSVTALPMNHPHTNGPEHRPVAMISPPALALSPADHTLNSDPHEKLERSIGCWSPAVSDRCSFNVTSFELLIGHPRGS
jgi:hypothetical protein